MYYVFTRRRANANPHVLWNRRRLAGCVQPLGAGPAQDPVQGDRPQQPDGGLDRRRGAVLARDAAQGFQRRDRRGHHAAQPDGNRRQDDPAASPPRGDGLRRQPLGQHRGLARGDEIALPDVARLEHQRDGGEPQHLEPARQARAELPARAGEDLREQDVGHAQEGDRGSRQLQHRQAALHHGQARQHHHRAGETGRSRDAQEARRERGARRVGEALRRRVRGRVEQHGRQNARPESSNPGTAGTDELNAVARRVTRFGLWLGGALVLAAALLIGVDVTLRKFFNASIGVADELARYALALGTAWSLGAALLDRAHIRIDSLYALFPRGLRLAPGFARIALLLAFFR